MSDYAKVDLEGAITSDGILGDVGGEFVLVKATNVTYKVYFSALDGFTRGDRLHVAGAVLRVSATGRVVVKATTAMTPSST